MAFSSTSQSTSAEALHMLHSFGEKLGLGEHFVRERNVLLTNVKLVFLVNDSESMTAPAVTVQEAKQAKAKQDENKELTIPEKLAPFFKTRAQKNKKSRDEGKEKEVKAKEPKAQIAQQEAKTENGQIPG